MERQVPAGISNIFEQIVQKSQEDRQREQAIKETYPLARALYEKANGIVEEYGLEHTDNKGKIVFYRETPPVSLTYGDASLEFMVREGYRHEHEKFRTMQIHQRREGGHFTTTPLFEIELFGIDDKEGTLPIRIELTDGSSGRLKTPLEDYAGAEGIKAVSDFLDIIKQSLSETHTPRSQRPKPEEPQRGLFTLLKRRHRGTV